MPTKTVLFRPFGDTPGSPSFEVTGDERDAGVVGELERSGGRYQSDLAHFLRRSVRPDAVVVDGGAHIGVITLLLSSLVPQGTVHAFEPTPSTLAYLEQNIAAGGATNVRVTAAALGRSDGKISLDPSDAYPAGAHVRDDGEGTCLVPAVTLDSWATSEGIERLDLLKLDVEGLELAVLAGAARTLARFRPLTVLECNPIALRRFGHTTWLELYAAMQTLFGSVAVIDEGGVLATVRSPDQLELLMGSRGVVDLVGRARGGGVLGWVADLDRRRRARRGPQTPSESSTAERSFVIDVAGFVHLLSPPVIEGSAGEGSGVRVRIANRSRWWLSSAFPFHPVHVACRVFDASGTRVVTEGHRTVLPAPVPPGGEVEMDVGFPLPAEPGSYEAVVSLVQEGYAWFDEVDPGTAARVRLVIS